MPHINLSLGKPIQERTGRELITGFVIVPVILGAILIGAVSWIMYQHRANFSRGDWLGVVWTVVLVLMLWIGLPTAAWREWERRKQFGRQERR